MATQNVQGGAGGAAQLAIDPQSYYQDLYNDSGMPNAPGYTAGYDPTTMSTADQLTAQLNGINPNTAGLDKFRTEAMRTGPSTWAQLASQQSYGQEAQAKDRAVSQSRAGVNQGEADLASKGGLSSGARERLARGGARDLLSVGQDTERSGNMNRMQIGINDETNRVSQLSQLPGMENQVYQDQMQKEGMFETAKTNDINRAVAENQNRNSYNQNMYGQQMQAWAADRQAQATENAGKK